MLEYGYRSKCCLAAIRFGFKINKKTNIKKQIMICCKCSKRDVDIVPTEDAQSQNRKSKPFVDEFNL